jgi:HAE1 family hydrophobic/amphiphilic exporter-1
MWILDFSIKRPVTVVVGIILVVLFGSIALKNMPIQMKPTIDKPFITIKTAYPAAAPQEVEEQITRPIEEKVQAVENLKKMTSSSSEGRSSITLEFDWGTDKDIATIDILKKLNLVGELPEEAETPIITAITSDEERPVYWTTFNGPMTTNQLWQIADQYVKPRFERIAGVGDVRIYGGQEREIRVVLDYHALAARKLSISDVRLALQKENKNVRGGHIDEGKRRYMVRTVGLFKTPEDVENVIIRSDEKGAVYLRDVAKVFDTYKEKTSLVKRDGVPSIAFGIIKKSGENTVKVTTGVEKAIEAMNQEVGPRGLRLTEAYDESDYIWDSINFVVSNIRLGAIFAILVLIFFLRSIRSTLIVGVTIPISLFATFIVLYALGRSLNIISLAGLAFAAGMILDNAIVVTENIYRHKSMGKTSFQAAHDGAVEVWGAVVASTLTTLAVFLPIIFVEEEAGQMFKDIALAISCAVGFSMIAAFTIIPMLTARYIAPGYSEEKLKERPFLYSLSMAGAGKMVHNFFVGSTRWLTRGTWRGILVVAGIIAVFFLTLQLKPEMEYMPLGNRNFVFMIMKPITGTNNEKVQEMSDIVAERINNMPEKKMMFHVVSDRFNGIGMRVKDEWKLRIPEMVDKVNKMVTDVPGFIFMRAFQIPLFQRSLGKGFDVEITGLEMDEVEKLGEEIKSNIENIEGVQLVRSSYDSGNPEYRITLDRERAADLGLSVHDTAEVIETMVAGKEATLFKVGGREYDITLRADTSKFRDFHALEELLIYTPSGEAVPLKSIANIEQTTGPTEINHVEQDRAVTLQVTIARDRTLERMMNAVTEQAIEPQRKTLPYGYAINLTGTAEDLVRTWNALSWSFILAIVIIYLLMSSLFESFYYPIIIMVTVPLATTGAIIGVYATGAELNVVTMLGFVILSGIVVNNGILIIHQTIRYRRDGMEPDDALVEAVKVRIRPIFMSSITTILGMIPLTFRAGAGGEVYSGLGAAIVGGLAFSTIFTLILLPALFTIFNRIPVLLGIRRRR